MRTQVIYGIGLVLACGAAGLVVDSFLMQLSDDHLPADPAAQTDAPAASAAGPSQAPSAETAATQSSARDAFLRTLMKPGTDTAVVIQRVDLPSSGPSSTADAPVALTLEGEYRAVKGRLLDWTTAAHALRLHEITLTRAPGAGDGRIVASVVLTAPTATPRP